MPMPPRSEAPGAIPLVLAAEVTGLWERHELTVVTVVGDEAEARAVAELNASGVEVYAVDRRATRGVARWRRRGRMAIAWARGPFPWRTIWFAEPEVQAIIDRLTATNPYDVAAVDDSAMGGYSFPAGLARVLTEHEVIQPQRRTSRPAALRGWATWAVREVDRRRFPTFQRMMWRRFDRVQVFTEGDAAEIAALAPDVSEHVRVNPFGIVLPAPDDGGSEEPGRLLFVGNFTHPPNRDAARWLVGELMPALRARYPTARLTVVGSPVPVDLAAESGAEVEFVGDVPFVRPYLERACVVVAPVRLGGGMRMKVLQALAHGKAVVTTSLGAEGLLFGCMRSFSIADDAEEFSIAAAALLSDVGLRRELGRRARDDVSTYHSPEAWAGRLQAIYEEAVTVRLRASAAGSRPLPCRRAR